LEFSILKEFYLLSLDFIEGIGSDRPSLPAIGDSLGLIAIIEVAF